MRLAIATLLALAGLAGAADDVDALKARVAELEAQLAELRKQAVPYRVLTTAHSQGLYNDGTLEDAAFALLQASDDEKKAMNAALAHAQSRMAELLQRSLPPISGISKLSFSFGPVDDEGVEAEMMKAIRAVLGDARADYFEQEIAGEIRSDFLSFGKGKIEVDISRQGKGGTGFDYELKESSDHGSSSTSGSYTDALPSGLRLLKPFIPRAFLGDAPDAP
jgi:hypothetical protein